MFISGNPRKVFLLNLTKKNKKGLFIMAMTKGFLTRAWTLLLLAILGGGLLLSACGDATATSSPAATTAAGGTAAKTTAASGTTAQTTTASGTTAQTTAAGGTAAKTTAASAGDTGATISFWTRDSDKDLVEPLVKAYNDTHKNQVKLTIIPAEQFVPKFGTAVAGDSAPDVVAIDLIYTPTFSAANQLVDITDKAKALPYLDKLSPSHMRLSTYKDKIYALPFSAEGSVLIYNKGLFKQAGLDPEKPPTTWAEIQSASKKITALGNGIYGFYFSGACGGCNVFTFLPYVWANGGDVLNPEGTKATWTDPKVKEAFNFYHQLWADKQVPQGAKVDAGTDFLNAFTSGKIGMSGTGAFAIGTLKTKYPNVDFGVTYLPGQTGGKSSFAGGDNIGIPKGSKHVNEAFDFISWFLSDDTQVEQVAKNGGVPVRTDLSNNKYSQQDPRYIVVSNAMALGRTPYSLKYNELFNDPNGPWLAAFQKAVLDGNLDEAMKNAQDQFTKILGQ